MSRCRTVVLTLVLLAAACGDGDDEVGAGPGGSNGGGEPAATFGGTITEATPFVPVTEDCVPAADLDPDGAVSSDDPPVCTDPTTAPLGSILVEQHPEGDGGEVIVFTIPQDARLVFRSNALGEREEEPIEFSNLAVGRRVEVGFSGQVAESFPGQATAESVAVIDPGS